MHHRSWRSLDLFLGFHVSAHPRGLNHIQPRKPFSVAFETKHHVSSCIEIEYFTEWNAPSGERRLDVCDESETMKTILTVFVRFSHWSLVTTRVNLPQLTQVSLLTIFVLLVSLGLFPKSTLISPLVVSPLDVSSWNSVPMLSPR